LGLAQAAKLPASSWHWKVPVSLLTKVKVALLLLVTTGGPLVMVVLGGVVSCTVILTVSVAVACPSFTVKVTRGMVTVGLTPLTAPKSPVQL